MFFVSEEFLRKYQEGEGFDQTIGNAVAVDEGEGLFDTTGGKREHNIGKRKPGKRTPKKSE